jgi:recombinational DNA repair protein RecR
MTNKEEFPSLPEQGKNIADLLAKAIRDAVEGNELFASEFEQQRRYNICEVCEHFSERQQRCKLCGCFLKNKVTFKSASCPIQKW